jgi:hypothetical protein
MKIFTIYLELNQKRICTRRWDNKDVQKPDFERMIFIYWQVIVQFRIPT